MNLMLSDSKNRAGFTLVELSIVIVIIGLIVAGVTAGQSLVKQAKLKTILTDQGAYFTAFRSFEMQYNGYPGDIANATSYWPAQTTDGNGDKKLTGNSEGLVAWQQLQLAGLVNNGNYNGVFLTNEVPGVTVGAASFSKNTGFNWFGFGVVSNNWGYKGNPVYGKYNSVVLGFGGVKLALDHLISGPALTPAEAYSLDQKVDDGVSNLGLILADNGYLSGIDTCTDGTNASAHNIALGTTVNYKIGLSAAACRMMFIYK